MSCKVCHLVAGGLSGGAARGALWLHQGLLAEGVDSTLLCDDRNAREYAGVLTADQRFGSMGARLRARADHAAQKLYRRRQRLPFSTGWPGIHFRGTDAYKQADILHLHWINAGFVDVKDLAFVDKPIVWTMRDMWPMTGGCHVAMECEGYTQRCGRCPQLGSKRTYDLSRFVFNRKKRYLPKRMYLVGLSRWLSECARQSTLFREHDIRTIPNCVDTEVFYPVAKATARQQLGLPQDRKIVLAGALSPGSIWKGFAELIAALNHSPGDFDVVMFGKVADSSLSALRRPWRSLGMLGDNQSLRLLYSAADVFVAPSRQESFGKTLAESLACGTPVVAFDATGPRDIVTSGVDGFLARPFDPESLAEGIAFVLEHADPGQLSANARRSAVGKFSLPVVAGQYKALYEEILQT